MATRIFVAVAALAVALAVVAGLLASRGSTPIAASHATSTATATATATATPAPTPVPLPPDSPAVDLDVYAAECMAVGPTSARAILMWRPADTGPQWLDLTLFNNGFLPGTFVTAGQGFGPGVWGFAWDGLAQGMTHYARVNTLTPAGWRSSSTLAFFTPVCDAANYEPQPAGDMLTLRSQLEAAVASSGINTAVAVTDLRTGETVDVNGNANRLPGCTINLFALLRVVVDLQDGRYAEPRPGDLIAQTINRSDPITARDLMKDYIGNGDIALGVLRVDEYLHDLGMANTYMDHPPAFTAPALYDGGHNRITARDVNRGLQSLWDGRAVSGPWRDYLLRKMTLVKPGLNYLIPAGVGGGATVSHKNGFLYAEGWADNDVGIVWFQRGGQRYGYAISFFTEGVATKYADIPLGQRVSSLAYQWFVRRYGYR